MIRASTESDLPSITGIYGWSVVHGVGTWEEVPPAQAEMARRREAVLALGLPWVVAELGGQVVGYAYAGPFRTRSGYRYTVEDSVYVAPGAQGKGVGRAMLEVVLGECRRLGVHQVIAGIGDSGNAASIALHSALGFERVGVFPNSGYKFGRWLDVVWMQLAMNGGGEGEPEGRGISF